MLQYLGKFVVRVAELLEAEGRAARRQVARLGAGLIVLTAAAALGVAGVVMMGVGMYLALASVMGRGGALALSGAMVLAVAAIAGWIARGLLRR